MKFKVIFGEISLQKDYWNLIDDYKLAVILM